MTDMLCPECLNVLETTDGTRARCGIHGEFEILFTRAAAPPQQTAAAAHAGAASGAVAAEGKCVRHPQVAARYACRNCGALVCMTCVFPGPDGTQLCPECATGKKPHRPRPPGAPPHALQNVKCAIHSDVQAVHRCKVCRTPVCETCAFEFPGRLFLCPKCATSDDQALSPKRRKYMIGSLVCACIATGAFSFVFWWPLVMTPTQSSMEAAGVLSFWAVLLSTIPGIALASAARFPGRPRPASVWVGLIWNTVLLVGFFALAFIGAAMG
jgi:hypothetical protein